MKILRYAAILLVALIALALLAFWFNQPPGLDKSTTTYTRLSAAKYGVATYALDFKDKRRLTQAHGGEAAKYHRHLQGTVWYPVNTQGDIPNGRLPLIVFSHGFGSMHSSMVYLHKHLAENGYIVAAVDFPLTRYGVKGGPLATDVVNQPGDVSALIDYMQAQSRDSASLFFNHIDSTRIGALGMSLGGMTTTLVSYHPHLSDDRIHAAVAVAPPLSVFEAPFYRFKPDMPFLMIAADADMIVPYAVNAADFQQKNPNAWFVAVEQGSHMGFVVAGAAFQFSKNPDQGACSIIKDLLKKNPVSHTWQRDLGDASFGIVEFFDDKPCNIEASAAMHPKAQQRIAASVIRAFFDTQFLGAGDASEAKRYMTEQMSQELPVLSVYPPVNAR